MEVKDLPNAGVLLDSADERAPKRVKLAEQEPLIAPAISVTPPHTLEKIDSEFSESNSGNPIAGSVRDIGEITSTHNGGGKIENGSVAPRNPGMVTPPEFPASNSTTSTVVAAFTPNWTPVTAPTDDVQPTASAHEGYIKVVSRVAGSQGSGDRNNFPYPAPADSLMTAYQQEGTGVMSDEDKSPRRPLRRTRKTLRRDKEDNVGQDEAMDGAFDKPDLPNREPATLAHPGKDRSTATVNIVTSDIVVNIKPASPEQFRPCPSADSQPFSTDASNGTRSEEITSVGFDYNDIVDGLAFNKRLLGGKLTGLELLDWAYQSVTDNERREFRGFVDLESDPDKLNHVLAKLGLTEFKLNQMYEWSDDSFSTIPDNTAGLIFLARYTDEDKSLDQPSCPEDIWFANQTSENACATIALINVAMNAETMRIGDVLYNFKQQTLEYDSPVRGYVLANNDDIRAAHNSFASRLDMFKADHTWVKGIKKLASVFSKMDVEEAKAEKASRAAERGESPSKRRRLLPFTKSSVAQKDGRPPAASRKKKKKPPIDPDAPFHYVAYVPIGSEVWELDGMKRQPLHLGAFSPDANDEWGRSPTLQWCNIARRQIGERFGLLTGEYGVIAQGDEHVHMSLLAMQPSPAYDIREKLAGVLRGVWMLLDRFRSEVHHWAPHRAAQIAATHFHNFRPPGWSSMPPEERIARVGGPKRRLLPASDFCDLLLGEVEHLDIDEVGFAADWNLGNMTWQEAEEQFHAAYETLMPELRVAYIAETKGRMEEKVANFSPIIQKWVGTLAKDGSLKEIMGEMDAKQREIDAQKKAKENLEKAQKKQMAKGLLNLPDE